MSNYPCVHFTPLYKSLKKSINHFNPSNWPRAKILLEHLWKNPPTSAVDWNYKDYSCAFRWTESDLLFWCAVHKPASRTEYFEFVNSTHKKI